MLTCDNSMRYMNDVSGLQSHAVILVLKDTTLSGHHIYELYSKYEEREQHRCRLNTEARKRMTTGQQTEYLHILHDWGSVNPDRSGASVNMWSTCHGNVCKCEEIVTTSPISTIASDTLWQNWSFVQRSKKISERLSETLEKSSQLFKAWNVKHWACRADLSGANAITEGLQSTRCDVQTRAMQGCLQDSRAPIITFLHYIYG